MTDRLPRAITPLMVSRARAIVHLYEQPEWYNLSADEAVRLMSKACAGSVHPSFLADDFRSLVRSVGLKPISDGN